MRRRKTPPLACVTDVPFPRTNTPGVSKKKWREGVQGMSKKGGEVGEGGEERIHFLPQPFPLLLSRSLAVSIPSSALGNKPPPTIPPSIRKLMFLQND